MKRLWICPALNSVERRKFTHLMNSRKFTSNDPVKVKNLSEEIVKNIRKDFLCPPFPTQYELAKKYKVNQSLISRIVTKKIHK